MKGHDGFDGVVVKPPQSFVWILTARWDSMVLSKVGDQTTVEQYEINKGPLGDEYWWISAAGEFGMQCLASELVWGNHHRLESPPTVAEARKLLEDGE